MAAVGGLGWERSPPPGSKDDTAANTDTDSDADTDSDTDSDTDADCSAVPVCGGDPTGFWSATDVCPDTTQQPIEGCDGGYTSALAKPDHPPPVKPDPPRDRDPGPRGGWGPARRVPPESRVWHSGAIRGAGGGAA